MVKKRAEFEETTTDAFQDDPPEVPERKSERIISPKGVECPGCNGVEFYALKSGQFQCKKCSMVVELKA
jgi:hypothetical protein